MLRYSRSIAGAFVAATMLVGMVAMAADKVPAAVAAAVADKGRPDADKERDANRKPAEVIAFAGIKKGEKIIELIPGSGYWTRIFSKIVGDKGVVYAAAPSRRPDAPADAPDPAAGVKAIAADYKNVKVGTLFGDSWAPEPVDVVWTSDNYHDVHNRPNADLMAFNKAAFNALKPGGTYIVIDHAAEAGSGVRDTSTLHRIDPQAVKSEVTAAGFEFVGQSDALHNPQDPHTAGVRDPSVRGKTDQFVFKFRKPAK
jgi:predicted methyltransferase